MGGVHLGLGTVREMRRWHFSQWGRWWKISVQTFSNLFLKILSTEAMSLFHNFINLTENTDSFLWRCLVPWATFWGCPLMPRQWVVLSASIQTPTVGSSLFFTYLLKCAASMFVLMHHIFLTNFFFDALRKLPFFQKWACVSRFMLHFVKLAWVVPHIRIHFASLRPKAHIGQRRLQSLHNCVITPATRLQEKAFFCTHRSQMWVDIPPQSW